MKTSILFALLLSFSLKASERSFRLLEFKNAQALELRGEVELEELRKSLAPFGVTAVANKYGKGELSIGAFEYPLVFKRFREFWIAGLGQRGSHQPAYTYIYVITNNPLPRWLNQGLGYHLPLEKGNIGLNAWSFSVGDIFLSMGPDNLSHSFETLKLEHVEQVLVSRFRLEGEILTRKFDPKRDEIRPSAYLKQLRFKPHRWILRHEASGTVEVPRR